MLKFERIVDLAKFSDSSARFAPWILSRLLSEACFRSCSLSKLELNLDKFAATLDLPDAMLSNRSWTLDITRAAESVLLKL